jgi:hypothetical protein
VFLSVEFWLFIRNLPQKGAPFYNAWKWLLGVAMIAASGVGAFLLTEKGQQSLRRWLSAWGSDSAPWDASNEGAQLELEPIQAALNRIAQSLEPGDEFAAPSR